MRFRTLTVALIAAAIGLGALSPARADWDNWQRREWREHAWRERAWREHQWREHVWRERHTPQFYAPFYAPPPVVVVPRRPYYGWR